MTRAKFLFALIFALLALSACASSAPGAEALCDSAQFVDHVIVDVPVEQGTLVMPGLHFTKTWRVHNNGECTWTSDYALVFQDGSALGAAGEQSFSTDVAPGESINLALSLTAPLAAGEYRGEWLIRNGAGEPFGVAADGLSPLVAEIEVTELPVGWVYAFSQMHCLAEWHTAMAAYLPCEGGEDEEVIRLGYVRLALDPALEGSIRGNPPVIELKPNNQPGGWIAGIFPPITLADGDLFRATIGCLDGNPDCSIIFLLDVELPDGSTQTLGEWPQIFDEMAADIEVDLSAFAGERPRLILRVEENGGRSLEAIGFWLDARIERSP